MGELNNSSLLSIPQTKPFYLRYVPYYATNPKFFPRLFEILYEQVFSKFRYAKYKAQQYHSAGSGISPSYQTHYTLHRASLRPGAALASPQKRWAPRDLIGSFKKFQFPHESTVIVRENYSVRTPGERLRSVREKP